MYEQRDLVIIPFPYSDLTGVKLRPAIILSNGKIGSDRICCVVTSNPQAKGVQLSLENGKLHKDSWAKPQILFTIDERIIKKKVGRISKQVHNTIIGILQKNFST